MGDVIGLKKFYVLQMMFCGNIIQNTINKVIKILNVIIFIQFLLK